MNMTVGKRYIVTKGSDDGTFEVGDHIVLCGEGDMVCQEAEGWLESEDVAESTRGMRVKIDKEWIKRRKQQLRQELEELHG